MHSVLFFAALSLLHSFVSAQVDLHQISPWKNYTVSHLDELIIPLSENFKTNNNILEFELAGKNMSKEVSLVSPFEVSEITDMPLADCSAGDIVLVENWVRRIVYLCEKGTRMAMVDIDGVNMLVIRVAVSDKISAPVENFECVRIRVAFGGSSFWATCNELTKKGKGKNFISEVMLTIPKGSGSPVELSNGGYKLLQSSDHNSLPPLEYPDLLLDPYNENRGIVFEKSLITSNRSQMYIFHKAENHSSISILHGYDTEKGGLDPNIFGEGTQIQSVLFFENQKLLFITRSKCCLAYVKCSIEKNALNCGNLFNIFHEIFLEDAEVRVSLFNSQIHIAAVSKDHIYRRSYLFPSMFLPKTSPPVTLTLPQQYPTPPRILFTHTGLFLVSPSTPTQFLFYEDIRQTYHLHTLKNRIDSQVLNGPGSVIIYIDNGKMHYCDVRLWKVIAKAEGSPGVRDKRVEMSDGAIEVVGVARGGPGEMVRQKFTINVKTLYKQYAMNKLEIPELEPSFIGNNLDIPIPREWNVLNDPIITATVNDSRVTPSVFHTTTLDVKLIFHKDRPKNHIPKDQGPHLVTAASQVSFVLFYNSTIASMKCFEPKSSAARVDAMYCQETILFNDNCVIPFLREPAIKILVKGDKMFILTKPNDSELRLMKITSSTCNTLLYQFAPANMIAATMDEAVYYVYVRVVAGSNNGTLAPQIYIAEFHEDNQLPPQLEIVDISLPAWLCPFYLDWEDNFLRHPMHLISKCSNMTPAAYSLTIFPSVNLELKINEEQFTDFCAMLNGNFFLVDRNKNTIKLATPKGTFGYPVPETAEILDIHCISLEEVLQATVLNRATNEVLLITYRHSVNDILIDRVHSSQVIGSKESNKKISTLKLNNLLRMYVLMYSEDAPQLSASVMVLSTPIIEIDATNLTRPTSVELSVEVQVQGYPLKPIKSIVHFEEPDYDLQIEVKNKSKVVGSKAQISVQRQIDISGWAISQQLVASGNDAKFVELTPTHSFVRLLSNHTVKGILRISEDTEFIWNSSSLAVVRGGEIVLEKRQYQVFSAQLITFQRTIDKFTYFYYYIIGLSNYNYYDPQVKRLFVVYMKSETEWAFIDNSLEADADNLQVFVKNSLILSFNFYFTREENTEIHSGTFGLYQDRFINQKLVQIRSTQLIMDAEEPLTLVIYLKLKSGYLIMYSKYNSAVLSFIFLDDDLVVVETKSINAVEVIGSKFLGSELKCHPNEASEDESFMCAGKSPSNSKIYSFMLLIEANFEIGISAIWEPKIPWGYDPMQIGLVKDLAFILLTYSNSKQIPSAHLRPSSLLDDPVLVAVWFPALKSTHAMIRVATEANLFIVNSSFAEHLEFSSAHFMLDSYDDDGKTILRIVPWLEHKNYYPMEFLLSNLTVHIKAKLPNLNSVSVTLAGLNTDKILNLSDLIHSPPSPLATIILVFTLILLLFFPIAIVYNLLIPSAPSEDTMLGRRYGVMVVMGEETLGEETFDDDNMDGKSRIE